MFKEFFVCFDDKKEKRKTYFSFDAVGLTEYYTVASFLRMFGALVLDAMALTPQRTESVWKSLTRS
jgi:hypothetical protein